jgi:hypothetical protein
MTETVQVLSINRKLIKASSTESNKPDSVFYSDGALSFPNTSKIGMFSTRPNLVNKSQECLNLKTKKTVKISNMVTEFLLPMSVLMETVKMATSQLFYPDTISTQITQISLLKSKPPMKS